MRVARVALAVRQVGGDGRARAESEVDEEGVEWGGTAIIAWHGILVGSLGRSGGAGGPDELWATGRVGILGGGGARGEPAGDVESEET